jgi:TonB family protein
MEPKRTKTLFVSVGIHVLILVLLVIEPSLFETTPKRIIRIAGQNFDLDKTQLTELTMPPPPRPHSTQPLVQPPQPKPEPPPPPPPQQQQAPPPPPPPPKQMPAISPEDILKEGARPDGKVQASRGNTQELRANGGSPGSPDEQKAAAPKQESQRGQQNPPQLAQNLNPNAMRLPDLRAQAGKIVDQTVQQDRKQGSGSGQGGRTGVLNGPVEPNFATDQPQILSDTKGYDFGPYMNGVINRVRLNWYPMIPEIARLGQKGRVSIIFTITRTGGITDIHQVANSGSDPLDRAAMGSITASNPFSPLPPNFDGDKLTLQFTFLYNLYPQK